MSESVRITTITFNRFKALKKHQLELDHLNILVGPNNCGKSTLIGAIRALQAGLRVARSRSPERISAPLGRGFGYRISESSLPISLENVHTDYGQEDSSVTFQLSNRNKLHLLFPADGGCLLVPDAPGVLIRSTSQFKQHFPVELTVVPVLGPVEHREVRRERDTVVAGLGTHRASRHFRSYWYHFQEGFEEFGALVKRTWPGMEIQKPEITDFATGELSMFCLEGRMTRELYWAGFGFQVWCQLLTHVSRAAGASLVVVDEPEVYLHPDIQRQLIGILRSLGPDVLIATHSTEIMAEAEPGDIVLVDKQKPTLERLRDIRGVQRAMDAVGSVQNITLTALARNRRLLFVEGDGDFRLLRRVANRLGLVDLASGLGITPLESGGFGSWRRVTVLAEGIGQALGTELAIGAIYDRDYFCQEEIDEVEKTLSGSLRLAHVHRRKEIENYLLIPPALDRAIARAAADRAKRGIPVSADLPLAAVLLEEITEPMRDEVQSQLIARRTSHLRSTGRDVAALTRETLAAFAPRWSKLSTRLELVPGKEVLKLFRERVQQLCGLSITEARIVDSMRRDEVPPDLSALLNEIEAFRSAEVQ